MLTALLLVAAVMLFGGKDLATKAKTLLAAVRLASIPWRQIAAAGLVLLAVGQVLVANRAPSPLPVPPPEPPQPVALDLAGLFQGPTAAQDAAIVAAITAELAEEIIWDSQQGKPYLTTGVAVDELRRRVREARCRGVSIGARQPAARDAIAKHLDDAVGNGGGPLDDAKKAAWVKALVEIAEAADRVTK